MKLFIYFQMISVIDGIFYEGILESKNLNLFVIFYHFSLSFYDVFSLILR